ncbi:hypothetical protein [Amycolatopsis alba]|uniref:Uncharacterized protein n=1 Tax=Amycolatopsis alba DSM 44262 TaxID=1125972 RepID=A0A229RBK9_AMYAL|nr:hypothetical protein [Amycolatopsis alba]OXM43879.1 hypothetical protein CFP75_36815 [Amycolatopsis alba DSM 44262]
MPRTPQAAQCTAAQISGKAGTEERAGQSRRHYRWRDRLDKRGLVGMGTVCSSHADGYVLHRREYAS